MGEKNTHHILLKHWLEEGSYELISGPYHIAYTHILNVLVRMYMDST